MTKTAPFVVLYAEKDFRPKSLGQMPNVPCIAENVTDDELERTLAKAGDKTLERFGNLLRKEP